MAKTKKKTKAKKKTKTAKKAAKPMKAKRTAAKRKPATKTKAAKHPAKKAKRDVMDEGNYTAARNFRKKETSYIRNNRATIAKKAKEAERAMEGPERAELMRAEEETGARGQE